MMPNYWLRGTVLIRGPLDWSAEEDRHMAQYRGESEYDPWPEREAGWFKQPLAPGWTRRRQSGQRPALRKRDPDVCPF